MEVVDNDHASYRQPRVESFEGIPDPVVGVRINTDDGKHGWHGAFTSLGCLDRSWPKHRPQTRVEEARQEPDTVVQ